MNKTVELFKDILNEIPNITEGRMFGAPCIKVANGKVVVVLWKDCILFKLDEKSQKEVLKLEGVKIASHLYNSSKPMNGWVSIPFIHSDKWSMYAKKAVEQTVTLT